MKNDKNILLQNIEKLHTTEMGKLRIEKNLNLKEDAVCYCKQMIKNNKSYIYKQGKNWYCEIDNIRITIHSYSYTIITAHIVKSTH